LRVVSGAIFTPSIGIGVHRRSEACRGFLIAGHILLKEKAKRALENHPFEGRKSPLALEKRATFLYKDQVIPFSV